MSPSKHCAAPSCPEYVPFGVAYCSAHEPPRKPDTERPSARERGYAALWLGRRRAQLREHPVCECGPVCCPLGCLEIAHIADHWPKARKRLVAEGVRDPDDLNFLRSLARRCDNSERKRRGIDASGIERDDPPEMREQLIALRRSRGQKTEWKKTR